jgi:hypothetical protein
MNDMIRMPQVSPVSLQDTAGLGLVRRVRCFVNQALTADSRPIDMLATLTWHGQRSWAEQTLIRAVAAPAAFEADCEANQLRIMRECVARHRHYAMASRR